MRLSEEAKKLMKLVESGNLAYIEQVKELMYLVGLNAQEIYALETEIALALPNIFFNGWGSNDYVSVGRSIQNPGLGFADGSKSDSYSFSFQIEPVSIAPNIIRVGIRFDDMIYFCPNKGYWYYQSAIGNKAFKYAEKELKGAFKELTIDTTVDDTWDKVEDAVEHYWNDISAKVHLKTKFLAMDPKLTRLNKAAPLCK